MGETGPPGHVLPNPLVNSMATDPIWPIPWPAPYTAGVYVVRTCPGFVKVGKSIDIAKRFRELQQCTPYPVQFLGLLSGNPDDERHFHGLFQPWRVRGEWFRFEGAVEEVIRKQAEAPEPPQRSRTDYFDCLGDD